jgi:hypothetical protein
MTKSTKEFFYDEDSGRILGIIAKDSTSWLAQTIFGYTIARTDSRENAERVLFRDGTSVLRGVWQYFDSDEQEWFPCVIQEANEKKVVITRTNGYGVQDSKTYKHVILTDPTEEVLMKMS